MAEGKVQDGSPQAFAFEEFRLVYESAEKVTDRRLELNRANASLSILVIGGRGIVAGWAYDPKRSADAAQLAIFVVFTVSILSIYFCRWWHAQLVAYKELNAAKFDVLNEMAKNVVFPDHPSALVVSAKPFEREWDLLEQRRQLGKFKRGFALSSSPSELTIPKSFLIFFFLTASACVVLELVLSASYLAKIAARL